MAPIVELLAKTQNNLIRLANITAIVSAAFVFRLLALIIEQHLNRQLNDGFRTPFAIVTFPDGSDPTAPPV
jgi:hypothetical protein